MKLVIAEKPSVAKSIAAVLGATDGKNGYQEGNGWRVSWCVGHLAEAAQPDAYNPDWKKWKLADLPLLPEPFSFQIMEKTEDQFAVLKRLLNDNSTELVINACDAGREGELIFRNVYNLSNCSKPMKRLWISSMEDAAIRAGFASLQDSAHYDKLFHSAFCRAEADWLTGINGSRFFSLTFDAKLNVGRVMTPTLALLVQREAEIDAFAPKVFWTVVLDLGGFSAATERLQQREKALTLAESCGNTATVTSVEQKERSEKAPALYDLTTLQRDANRILGYEAQQTLDYLQSLYEKKLCTYPRTDSRFLTDDMQPVVEKHVAVAGSVCGAWAPDTVNAGQVCDSSKVSDHHALIPTLAVTPNAVEALPLGEREILRLVSYGLLRAVSPAHRYSETVVCFFCAGTTFKAKGKTVLEPGWKAYDRKPETESGEEKTKKETVLPELTVGQALPIRETTVKAGKTSPPKHYTEDTLLAAMEAAGAKDMPEDAERKGLGTPATRAGVIEKLITTGYVERQKVKKVTNLLPTVSGKALIAVLPQEIQSPQLTAEWEHRLKEIERGELEPEEFLQDIKAMLSGIIRDYKPNEASRMLFPPRNKKEAVGKCPRCGKDVIEIQKGFVCQDRACGFSIWKASHFFTNKGISPSPELIAALLSLKPVLLRCFSQKTEKPYLAKITLTDDGKNTDFKMEFPKSKKGRRK